MTPQSHTAISERPATQAGYTLTAVLIMLTILAVVLAHTVPSAWSDIMRRERDRQTIWVMKQYARAIVEFQRTHNSLPTSLKQLEEQTQPRVIRRLYANPLSGELDWILIPPGTAPAPGVGAPGLPQQPQPQPQQPGFGGAAGGYAGPFVGVRPPQSGPSFLPLKEQDQYENWSYTTADLQQELGGAQPAEPPRIGGPPNHPGRN